MHNQIIYSDGIAFKERSTFHLSKNESSGTGVKGTDGKMPDYVASLKDVSKRKKQRKISVNLTGPNRQVTQGFMVQAEV